MPGTTNAQSTHLQIRDAVVSLIDGLNLEDVQGNRLTVYGVRFGEMQMTVQYPCCLVLAFGTESAEGGTCGKDDIGYPILVMFLDREPHEDDTYEDPWLGWRRAVRNTFINQRKVSSVVNTIYNCRWEPGPIKSPTALEYLKVAGSMVLRFMSRETRGP